MKILAFYLPQFHEIPENNEWWGKGFTDWTNVKKAKPLVDGQYQPREPLNDNYYDLSNVEVMKWQSKIAQEHGIYGFCYYHYWFDGKLLLEKPLENMLHDKEVTIPFCFSWANEPWARTWDGRETDVLMPQRYGDEKEWEEHFEYLLQFFKDERYIKEDNKPMMVLYKTMHIPRVEEMCECWDKLAKENGFEGIYFVETLAMQLRPYLKCSNAVALFEPNFTRNDYKPKSDIFSRVKRRILKKTIQILNYNEVWNDIIERNIEFDNKKVFYGGFLDWDNTARKGMKGIVFNGANPEKFGIYLNKLKNKSKNDYIFINAWNEWAEGTYLEPDKKYQYGYLKAIQKVLNDE